MDEFDRFASYLDTVKKVAKVREETIARLMREREALVKALEPVAGLRVYVNNPSAWGCFDDEMSERLRPIVDGATAALASLNEPKENV